MMRLVAVLVLLMLLAACTTAEPTPAPSPPAEPPPLATFPAPVVGTPPPAATSAARSPSPGTASPAPSRAAPTGVPAPTSTAEGELVTGLQGLLDRWLADSGAAGAVLGLRLADGSTTVVAAGQTDDAGGSPVEVGHRFRIGSITKTFVAVLLMQLAEQGLLKLDDPLAEYLPWAPHAEQVSLRQLLAHTSGMPDFAAEAAYRQALLAQPGREWTARETVKLVAQRDLLFEPGSRWAYSNTNYTLAGLVAEEVTGEALAVLLRERIAEPAGLTDTYLEGMEEAPPIETAGHFDIDGDGRPENVRVVPYTGLVTSGAAAGGLSSTARDVLSFAAALAEGRLLSSAAVEELTAPSAAGPGYGLGVSLFRRAGREFWGHAGALPGYSALFAHARDEDVTAVALANQTGMDLQRLLEDAFASIAGQAGSDGRAGKKLADGGLAVY